MVRAGFGVLPEPRCGEAVWDRRIPGVNLIARQRFEEYIEAIVGHDALQGRLNLVDLERQVADPLAAGRQSTFATLPA